MSDAGGLQLDAVDATFARIAERGDIPGISYGVVADGRLVHAGAFGTLRVDEDAPPDADSVFRIASMTKSFTAATVLLLRDEGRLRLDDPVGRWVPELADLAGPTADSPPITIEHLLTMSSGLPTDDPWGDRQQGLPPDAFAALLRGGLSFAWVPGTRFEYSNLGYGILGRVITAAAGAEYKDVVRTRMLEPLGLTSTGYEVAEVPVERLARGYLKRDEAWLEEPIDPYGALAPMGGIFTSVRDLARWVAGFLDAVPPRDDPEGDHPLRRATRREMQQIRRSAELEIAFPSAEAVASVSSGGYGYGLFVWDDPGLGRVVGHGGGYPGFGSNMRWHPASGIGVVAVANARYARMGPAVREALGGLVRGTPARVRRLVPWPATLDARTAVERLLDRWDDAEADALFAMNVELDEPLERRRAEIERLRSVHGRLTADPTEPVESDSRVPARLVDARRARPGQGRDPARSAGPAPRPGPDADVGPGAAGDARRHRHPSGRAPRGDRSGLARRSRPGRIPRSGFRRTGPPRKRGTLRPDDPRPGDRRRRVANGDMAPERRPRRAGPDPCRRRQRRCVDDRGLRAGSDRGSERGDLGVRRGARR